MTSTDSPLQPAADHRRRQRLLKDNLQRVSETIAAAAQRSGREPQDIRLVAVTKTVEIDVIRMAIELGLTELGENRVQSLTRRAGMVHETLKRKRTLGGITAPAPPRWHMIGHLQRNKIRALLRWSRIVHSVDSLRLAEELSAEALRQDSTVDVLLQLNLSGEKSKYGLAVGATDLLVEQISALPGLRLSGLMTMAPLIGEERDLRPVFARLRDLAEDLRSRGLVGDAFRELSMGMSNDYEIAIEEGATLVRLGSVLFGGLGAA